ncbi:MAG TPA: disulfide bond formation protein B [Thiobacillaceae bacterium]|nr:disulfide bond formation protein B [Thiobacillaceae bacterium]HNU63150.1 disulfide bond formation protein B [Thiobacillaceae bacterium]
MNTAQHGTWNRLFLAWLVAAVSTLGALFFSEVMRLPPCELCWWQRICMFPLMLLLPLGLFPLDPRVVRYTLPLALAGWGFALFHWLLVLGLVPASAQPCRRGIPCGEVGIQWLGFLNLPLMSLLAFSLIIALLASTRQKVSP